jgi:hypothetical protein
MIQIGNVPLSSQKLNSKFMVEPHKTFLKVWDQMEKKPPNLSIEEFRMWTLLQGGLLGLDSRSTSILYCYQYAPILPVLSISPPEKC